jgi:iron complex transport system substrate-binding protein
MRIISLIPSATEIVCALGCQGALVGRSHECDFPQGIAELPALTEPKFPLDGTSYEIDQKVKAIVQEGTAVYRVFADWLAQLGPDVIVTQDQCEVCAASLGDVQAALCEWTGKPVSVVSLRPNALEDVWADMAQVAQALDVAPRGEALVAALRARIAQVHDMAVVAGAPRQRVACVEWIDPLMGAGGWMPELIALAGGECLFAKAGEHAPWLDWDDFCRADPDVIVITSCGFDIERSRRELPALVSRPGWPALSAVRAGRVFIADGNQYFNRPGPRLVESLEILAQILHPGRLDFGHAGSGFVPFSRPLEA